MPPKKAAAKKGDKGKADEDTKNEKKGGKGGKEQPAKGKGKEDPKKGKGKGKQAVASESEEGSDAEQLQSEVDSETVDEEELEEEGGKGKGKGKAALKGASKAVAVKAAAKPKRGQAAEETGKRANMKGGAKPEIPLGKMKDINIKGASSAMINLAAEKQKVQKKEEAKAHLKGASKILTGLAGKSSPFSMPAPKQPKRGLKSTSRLFMRLSKKKKDTPKLQSPSKLFSGFGKPKADDIKNTSKFMSGLLGGGKNKNEKKEQGGKPLLMLNLGGKTAAATSGLGGKFKSFFGKKNTGVAKFKNKGWALGKISGATNWLTRKFITAKTSRGRLGRSVRYRRSDTERYNGYVNGGYEYDEGEFSYEEDNYDERSYGRNNPRGRYFGRDYDGYDHGHFRGPHQYDPYEEEYYEYPEDEYAFYGEEGNYYDPYYKDEYDYYGDEYYDEYDERHPFDYYDDRMDYYDYGHQGMDEYGYFENGTEYYDEVGYPVEDEYWYSGNELDYYNYGVYPEQFDWYGNQQSFYGQLEGLPEAHMMYSGYPNPYSQNLYSYGGETTSVYLDPLLGVNQPNMYVMEDIIEQTEPLELYGNEYAHLPMESTLIEDPFRLPRPQIKLFGKDKLEIANPPTPHIALSDFEVMSDMQYENLPTFPQPMGYTQQALQTGMMQTPLSPTATPMFIHQSSSPVPAVAGGLVLGHSPQLPSSPIPQAMPPFPLNVPVSPTLSRHSFGPHMPLSTPPSPVLSARRFNQNFGDQMSLHISSQDPMFQRPEYLVDTMQPTPMRQSPLPSPQLSIRRGIMSPVHTIPLSYQRYDIQPEEIGPGFSPRQGRRMFGPPSYNNNAQRPLSPLQRRQFSPPSSPQPSRRGPSPSATLKGKSPIPQRKPFFSRAQSPHAMGVESPLTSPHGSMRRRSPPSSPRLNMRQSDRSAPPPSSFRPIGGKNRNESFISTRSRSVASPQPSLRRSPPLSPRGGQQIEREGSPFPPHRVSSPIQRIGSPRPMSPSAHRAKQPLSPTPSRLSGRIQHESQNLPTRSSTRRFRGFGRNKVPMGTVKPSPVNPVLRRSRHDAPLMQNVAPFRPSIHNGTVGSGPMNQSATTSPVMLTRQGSRAAGFQSSKRFFPPGTPNTQRGFHRPIGRGRPVVRVPINPIPLRQSVRGPSHPIVMNGQATFAQQIPVKHAGPPSPQPSLRHIPNPALSPQLSTRPGSPQVSMRPRSPQLPVRPGTPHLPMRSASPHHSVTPGSPIPIHSSSPRNLSSPVLANALNNQAIRRTSLRSPFSPGLHPQEVSSFGQTVEQGDSLLLTNGSYYSPLQMSPLMPQINQGAIQSPSSALSSALQNPQLRNAVYSSPLQRPLSPHSVVTQPHIQGTDIGSPVLSNALQNPYLRNASFSSPLQRIPSPYPVVTQQDIQEDMQSSPVLSRALQNPYLRNASYATPLQTPLHFAPVAAQPSQQTVQVSPSLLSNALQNPHLRKASYTSPLQRSPTPFHQAQSHSSILSGALKNPNLQGASFRLPDGSVLSRNSGRQTEDTTPSLLSNALKNPGLRKASYRLPDGTVKPRHEVEQVGSPPSLLSNALQNANVRKASYRLPDGSILSRSSDQVNETKQFSPYLGNALQNANLRKASYRLPDGALLSRGQKTEQPSPLSKALQNTGLRKATYRLPDGTLLTKKSEQEAEQSISSHLSSALQNANLRSASYRLPNTSGLFRNPNKKEQTSVLSSALQNQNLRKASYRLPDGSIMARGKTAQSDQPSSPFLGNALKNANLHKASFKLSTSFGSSPEDPRYAVVTPQVQGQPGEHWAQIHTIDPHETDDVWSSERVLPHHTVQNLTKWSMYRDEELVEFVIPVFPGQEVDGTEPGWSPDREGEPQGHWYDKVQS